MTVIRFLLCMFVQERNLLSSAMITHPERLSALFLRNVLHFIMLHCLLWTHHQRQTERNRKWRSSETKQCGRSEERVNNLVDVYPSSPISGWSSPSPQSDDKTSLHNHHGILPSTTVNNPPDAALKNLLIGFAKTPCLLWNTEKAH